MKTSQNIHEIINFKELELEAFPVSQELFVGSLYTINDHSKTEATLTAVSF